MGALEQGLMLASAAPAAAAAAKKPVDPAAPPPAAPDPTNIPPPNITGPNPGGALSQALGIMRTAQSAVSADPLMGMAREANQKDQAVRDAAAAKIEGNLDTIAKMQAEPDPPRVSVPRLKPLPEAPEPVHRDPMRVFGQFLPVVAALGALTTREPAINALNAATAMVNAAKAQDKEEEAKQRQTWVDNLNLTVKNNEMLLTGYKTALDDRNSTMSEKLARIQALAAQNRDYVALAALKGGNLDSLSKFIQLQQSATDKLATLATNLSEQDARAQRDQYSSMIQFAQLELERRRAQNISMGDSIGPVLVKLQNSDPAKVAGGLDKVLSPGEIQALKLYMDINAGRTFSNSPGGGGGGGVSLNNMGGDPAAPAAPTQPQPAPDTAAVRAAQPQAITPAVLSARVDQAKKALRTPGVTRDQVRAIWIQEGLPPAEFDRQVK